MYIYIAWLFIFGSKKYLLLVLGINFFRDNLYKLVIYLILCLPKIKTNENLLNIVCDVCYSFCLACYWKQRANKFMENRSLLLYCTKMCVYNTLAFSRQNGRIAERDFVSK